MALCLSQVCFYRNRNKKRGEIFEQLGEFGADKAVIVGIGNMLKGDDGAGLLICQQLKGKISAK